jgi:hypothetical protein
MHGELLRLADDRFGFRGKNEKERGKNQQTREHN